jgi:hypothetical protein
MIDRVWAPLQVNVGGGSNPAVTTLETFTDYEGTAWTGNPSWKGLVQGCGPPKLSFYYW